jgi:hypothetical protein
MDLLSILRRRWILASALFLLTLAGTAYGFKKLPSTYQSTSSVVFLAPKNSTKVFGGNPYLAFNASLNMTADVVRYETNDSRTVSALSAQGYTATYLVTDAVDTAGPVLIVTVTGKNKIMVENTLSAVTNEISAKLAGLQLKIGPNNKIYSLVITYTQKPTQMLSKKARPLSVVAGGGIGLTLAITLIVDAMLIRRRNMKRTRPAKDDRRGRNSSWPDRDSSPAGRPDQLRQADADELHRRLQQEGSSPTARRH